MPGEVGYCLPRSLDRNDVLSSTPPHFIRLLRIKKCQYQTSEANWKGTYSIQMIVILNFVQLYSIHMHTYIHMHLYNACSTSRRLCLFFKSTPDVNVGATVKRLQKGRQ